MQVSQSQVCTEQISGIRVLSKKDMVREDRKQQAEDGESRTVRQSNSAYSDVRPLHQQECVMSLHTELCAGQAEKRTWAEKHPSVMFITGYYESR